MHFHRLLAASATAVITVAMAPAAMAASSTPPLTDGFVSVAAGGAWFPDETDSDNNEHGMSLEGAASGEYNFTSVLGFQGDLVVQSQHFEFDNDPSEDTSTLRNADAALHVFYRDSSQFLYGGFVQFGTDTFSFDGSSFASTDDRYYAGAEAQYFLGDATLYGQAGAQQVTFDGQSAPGWFATFEARYFLQPDFKIEAHIGANDFSTGGGDLDVNVNSWNAGVGAEYKFANAPFSIFAKYDFTHEDSSAFGSTDTFDDNRVLVGVKFNFGAETLEDRDRSGASLKPVSSPAFAAPEEAN